MKNDWRYYLSFVFLLLGFLPAGFSPTSAQTSPTGTASVSSEIKANKVSVAEENLIHTGDLIDVDVLGSTEYDWRGTLNPEGFLSGINFTKNPVFALCQTEEAVAEKVAASYAAFLRQPQINVKILDRSRRPLAFVYGAVKKNQRLQIKRAVLLNELIVISGGFTDKASGEIQIIRSPNLNCSNESSEAPREQTAAPERDSEALYLNVKIIDVLAGRENPQILSGDVVTILESKPIYIVGAVGVPKQIAVRTQTTLSRAVDSAGGLLKNADAKKITIFRRGENGGETKIIEADLDKIRTASAEDVILQAFDIVEVAQTGSAKRKFPPALKMDAALERSAQNLPLRVID